MYGWNTLKVDYFDRENVFIKFFTAATKKLRDKKQDELLVNYEEMVQHDQMLAKNNNSLRD